MPPEPIAFSTQSEEENSLSDEDDGKNISEAESQSEEEKEEEVTLTIGLNSTGKKPQPSYRLTEQYSRKLKERLSLLGVSGIDEKNQ